MIDPGVRDVETCEHMEERKGGFAFALHLCEVEGRRRRDDSYLFDSLSDTRAETRGRLAPSGHS